MSESDRPYRILGWHLKLAREQLSESLDEVSGAVEIETEILEKIESGKSRPSEDILLLLINHLDVEDVEASSLWEMAGYVSSQDNDAKSNTQDNKVLYTDLVHMSINDAGVVINFLQTGNTVNQPQLVSRVGMSKEQANYMLKILQQTLHNSNLKSQLPPSTSSSDDNSTKKTK